MSLPKKRDLNIKDYIPYKGFYDLRDFKLSVKEFKSLWVIQDFLFNGEKNKKYLMKFAKKQWEDMKKLSCEYQQELFEFERVKK